MSARLDPEDMRDVIRAYQDICSGVIARYDGYLAKFMGDGVLAYFGFPRAHEDDAERAVRAGLDLADAIAKVQTRDGEVLKTRIGVATGIVVVGDLIGQGSAQEQAVIGDTPNLAARLQARAEPGGVLIADQTRRLLGNAFELKSLRFTRPEGIGRPGSRLGCLAGSRDRNPLRSVAIKPDDAVRRTRTRGRTAYRAMAGRMLGRRQGRVAFRRSRHRQVAHFGYTARTDSQRAASRYSLSMLPPSRERCVLPFCQPHLARGGIRERRVFRSAT